MNSSPDPHKSGLSRFVQPRFLLIVWLWAGAIGIAYVLLMAMIPQDTPRPGEDPAPRNLIVGEMADFTPAFPPRGAPQVPFVAPGGEPAALQDFRGKVILVNLWATWCAPCLEELPSLDTLQAELGSEDFSVVAIAAEPRAEDKARRFFEENDIDHLALYSDPMLSLASAMGGTGALPISILYDARGREIGRLTGGADWAGADARALIEAVIAGRDVS